MTLIFMLCARVFGFYYEMTDESFKGGIKLLGPVLAERMKLDDENDGKWLGRPVSSAEAYVLEA